MATIEVEGKSYCVIDFIDGAKMKIRVVDTPDGEKIAVLRNRIWTWRTGQDRLQPSGQDVGMSNR